MTNQQTALSIEATEREVTGKKVKVLRRSGVTPGNLYGEGLESRSLQVATKDLENVIHSGGRTSIVNLSVGKDSYQTLIREIQQHPVTREILHADFHQIDMQKRIQTQVSLRIIGEAPASRLPDALLNQLIFQVVVECLPGSIPQFIEVDISSLIDFDMSILINDLELPEDLTIVGDNTQAIVRVGKSRVAAMDLRDTELDAEAAEVEEGAEEGAEEEGDQEDSSDDDEE
jgi:large subunit ribosomal protein L25|tara:strand:- start:3159 stop:3848 length:690 start_codon:yes stop_codon:yes gene_type:complete